MGLAGRAQVTILMLHYLLSLLVTVSVNYIAISSELHETMKKIVLMNIDPQVRLFKERMILSSG